MWHRCGTAGALPKNLKQPHAEASPSSAHRAERAGHDTGMLTVIARSLDEAITGIGPLPQSMMRQVPENPASTDTPVCTPEFSEDTIVLPPRNIRKRCSCHLAMARSASG